MEHATFKQLEAYMQACMNDSAHDAQHIYRVLYAALDIAATEEHVDTDILIAACLLHDIGRDRQFADPSLCHAREGASMAYDYLLSQSWSVEAAGRVRDCIATHRYRADNPPVSIEAKILFDADKLDATGAIGIARTLSYKGQLSEPMYLMDEEDNMITEGGRGDVTSFFQEYNFKLKKLYDRFYTRHASALGAERRQAASLYYSSLYDEIESNRKQGKNLLQKALTGPKDQ